MIQQEPPGEPEYVARLRAGDRDALAEVYDLFAPMVFRVGYRLLGETADAEDLVHDVFLGLAHAVRTFEARGSFEGWLRRVAARAALMKLRRRRARHDRHARYGRSLPVFHREPALADGLDLDQALERLEIKYRAVFVLKEMEGYSHEEIGEILGISVNSARVRLYRARQQLREYMRRGA